MIRFRDLLKLPAFQQPLRSGSEDDLAEEAARWDRGDFADGSWVDAPEAVISNERLFYRTGEDGVRRSIISCMKAGNDFLWAKGLTPSRMVRVSPLEGWESLNEIQRTGLCQLLWAGADDAGEFVILDAATGETIALHNIPTTRDAMLAW